MKTISGILILVALAISGCSTAVSPQKATRIDVAKTGLILATLERTGPGDTKYASIEFPFRPVDGRENPFKNPAVSSSKKLWLVEVPPGRYRIADWYLAAGSPRVEIAEQPFEFEVRPGQVTYIGRLEVAVVTMYNDVGIQMSSWVQPVLENHYARAVAEFRRQYPALDSVPVFNAAPAELFAWNPIRPDRFVAGSSMTNISNDFGIRAAPQPRIIGL